MDLFRFRCYLASLQGGELPNPKRLLAVASRPTKLAMGRLGIFSVSSFHALVTASLHFDVVSLLYMHRITEFGKCCLSKLRPTLPSSSKKHFQLGFAHYSPSFKSAAGFPLKPQIIRVNRKLVCALLADEND